MRVRGGAAKSAVRRGALDAGYFKRSERFHHGPPRVPMPATEVHINPIVAEAVSVLVEHRNDVAMPIETSSAPRTLMAPCKTSAARLRGHIAFS